MLWVGGKAREPSVGGLRCGMVCSLALKARVSESTLLYEQLNLEIVVMWRRYQ